jgi:hypothetical protein
MLTLDATCVLSSSSSGRSDTMNQRGRGFDPEQFFGPEGPFGPRGPLGPGGIFGPQGPFGSGGWPGLGGFGQGSGQGGFGQGGWAGERRGPRPGGARRARRGDVRSAILELLAERGPSNGYQVMQGIADATGGQWTPSSGAIYPALAQLEDEGLVEQVEIDGRKAYQLTEAGREAARSGPSLLFGGEAGREPEDPWAARRGPRGPGGDSHGGGAGHGWAGARHGGPRRAGGTTLWKALGSLAMATQAVGQAGDERLTTQAAELLDRARRDLYRMLAEAEVARDDDEEGRGVRENEGDEEITDGEIVED